MCVCVCECDYLSEGERETNLEIDSIRVCVCESEREREGGGGCFREKGGGGGGGGGPERQAIREMELASQRQVQRVIETDRESATVWLHVLNRRHFHDNNATSPPLFLSTLKQEAQCCCSQ